MYTHYVYTYYIVYTSTLYTLVLYNIPSIGKASLVLEETKVNLAVARKDRESLMRKRLDEVCILC